MQKDVFEDRCQINPQGPDAANTSALWSGFSGTGHKRDKTCPSVGKTRAVAQQLQMGQSNVYLVADEDTRAADKGKFLQGSHLKHCKTNSV